LLSGLKCRPGLKKREEAAVAGGVRA
jgi:hypothetical protein